MASSSSNVVGVHYRVGKKIGEGSFGVIFEGTNLLNNQQVAIKFVCQHLHTNGELIRYPSYDLFKGFWSRFSSLANLSTSCRNLERVMPHNYEMNTEHIKFLLAAVSISQFVLQGLRTDSRQLVFLMSTTSAKRAFTTSWSSTYSAPP
jgi:hypothetical protein